MKHTPYPSSPGLLLSYLRVRDGLSRWQLAKACNLHPNDICRLEQGHDAAVWKFRTLADYFHIPLDALARNDITKVVRDQKEKIVSTHPIQESYRKTQVLQSQTGCKGEDLVAEAERAMLAGTCFANAVNPCYADSPDAGFDILSFTVDGQPRYIEVKTTLNENASTPFFMSANELSFMQSCREKGLLYELHRVYSVNDATGWGREIYTLEDMADFEFVPSEFTVRRRKRA